MYITFSFANLYFVRVRSEGAANMAIILQVSKLPNLLNELIFVPHCLIDILISLNFASTMTSPLFVQSLYLPLHNKDIYKIFNIQSMESIFYKIKRKAQSLARDLCVLQRVFATKHAQSTTTVSPLKLTSKPAQILFLLLVSTMPFTRTNPSSISKLASPPVLAQDMILSN